MGFKGGCTHAELVCKRYTAVIRFWKEPVSHKKSFKNKSYSRILGWQKEVIKLIRTGGVSDLVREPNLMQPIQWENHKRETYQRASFRRAVCRSPEKGRDEWASNTEGFLGEVRLNILLFSYLRALAQACDCWARKADDPVSFLKC